jgi:hypothetical protein
MNAPDKALPQGTQLLNNCLSVNLSLEESNLL